MKRILMASLVLTLALLAQAAVAQSPSDALSATPPESAKPVKLDDPDRGTQNPVDALSFTPPEGDKPAKITDVKFDFPAIGADDEGALPAFFAGADAGGAGGGALRDKFPTRIRMEDHWCCPSGPHGCGCGYQPGFECNLFSCESGC